MLRFWVSALPSLSSEAVGVCFCVGVCVCSFYTFHLFSFLCAHTCVNGRAVLTVTMLAQCKIYRYESLCTSLDPCSVMARNIKWWNVTNIMFSRTYVFLMFRQHLAVLNNTVSFPTQLSHPLNIFPVFISAHAPIQSLMGCRFLFKKQMVCRSHSSSDGMHRCPTRSAGSKKRISSVVPRVLAVVCGIRVPPLRSQGFRYHPHNAHNRAVYQCWKTTSVFACCSPDLLSAVWRLGGQGAYGKLIYGNWKVEK